MRGRGTAAADEESLGVKFADQLWMSIRRVDRKKEPGFVHHDGEKIGHGEIEVFPPNWRTLAWTQIEESDLSRGEWYGEDGVYRVNIYGDPGSTLWHERVMGLYRGFMEGAIQ